MEQQDEAAPELGGAGLDDAEPPAGWQQAERFVAGLAVFFDDPAPLGVEVLHGWQLCLDSLCSFHHPQ